MRKCLNPPRLACRRETGMLQQLLISKFTRELKNPQFASQANLIKCLGDPTCLKILHVLSKEKILCPSDLSSILNVSMPAISHQLSRLKQMGILENKRMGQMICYSFENTKRAKLIKKLVNELI